MVSLAFVPCLDRFVRSTGCSCLSIGVHRLEELRLGFLGLIPPLVALPVLGAVGGLTQAYLSHESLRQLVDS